MQERRHPGVVRGSADLKYLKSIRILFLIIGLVVAVSPRARAQNPGAPTSGDSASIAAQPAGVTSGAPAVGIAATAQTAETNSSGTPALTSSGSDPIIVRLKNAPLSLVLNYLSDAAGYVINSELGTGSSSTRIRSNTLTLSRDSISKQELADLLLSALLRAGVVWEIEGRILTLTSMAEAQTDDRASGVSSRNRTGSRVTTNQIGDYFSLVGVLDYKQGVKAGLAGTRVFFDSSNSDFVRTLRVGDTIARVYKVTKIDPAAGTATLTAGVGSVEMKVGTQMRWYGGGSWYGPFEGTGAY